MATRPNIAFTSLWDNWPDSITVPVDAKSESACLLICGTAIGSKREIPFSPTMARHVRLKVSQSANAININEFQVFPPDAK